MKYLLLLLAILALLWLLRASFGRRQAPGAGRAEAPPAPRAMLSCAHCGVHLPPEEALPGRGGVFCDAAHRAAFESAHREP